MKNILPLIALGLFFPVSVCARISAVYTCNDLLKNSDVVVKGEVISVKDNGPLKVFTGKRSLIETQAQQLGANEHEVVFRVDRVINGEVPEKNITINFYQLPRSKSDAGMVSLNPHEYVVLFLKKTDKGYSLIDFDHGKLSASKKIGRNPNARGREGLADEFLGLLEDSESDLAGEGIKCLGELGIAGQYLPKLKQLKGSKNPNVRWKSLVWLSRNGDDNAAKDMVAVFSSSETLSAEAFLDLEDGFKSLSEQRRHNLAPNMFPLLRHSKSGIRRLAVRFFRNLKDRQYIPQLLPLLDDADRSVQYNAVMAICEAVRPKREGCPSTMLFEANPSKYVSEWKLWWETQKSDQK